MEKLTKSQFNAICNQLHYMRNRNFLFDSVLIRNIDTNSYENTKLSKFDASCLISGLSYYIESN